MGNIICSKNNNKNKVGSCFFTENVLKRSMFSLKIINCESGEAAPGLVIFDDDVILEENFGTSSGYVRFNNF